MDSRFADFSGTPRGRSLLSGSGRRVPLDDPLSVEFGRGFSHCHIPRDGRAAARGDQDRQSHPACRHPGGVDGSMGRSRNSGFRSLAPGAEPLCRQGGLRQLVPPRAAHLGAHGGTRCLRCCCAGPHVRDFFASSLAGDGRPRRNPGGARRSSLLGGSDGHRPDDGRCVELNCGGACVRLLSRRCGPARGPEFCGATFHTVHRHRMGMEVLGVPGRGPQRLLPLLQDTVL